MPQDRFIPTHLRMIGERLLGHEQITDTRTVYVFTHSPHLAQYYTPRLYRALDPEKAEQISAAYNDLVTHAHQRSLDSRSHDPKSLNFVVETGGAATIISEHMWVKGETEKLERSVLISTADLVLGGFYNKRDFLEANFEGVRVKKQDGLSALNEMLPELREGSTFDLIARDRNARIQVLPMPDDPEFVAPQLCLIGAKEAKDLPKILAQARKRGKQIVVHVKRTHLGLGRAYLESFNPNRVTIETDYEADEAVYPHRPRIGELNFILRTNEGYVDELVRDDKRAPADPFVEDYLGIDISQTGNSLKNNKLKKIEPVITCPSFPVTIKVKVHKN